MLRWQPGLRVSHSKRAIGRGKEPLVQDAAIAQNEAFPGGVFVRSQIPAAGISGFRKWTAEARGEVGETGCGQTGQHLWPAPAEHAGDADGVALRGVRSAAGKFECDPRAVSEVRMRSAFLQAMRALRPFEPL